MTTPEVPTDPQPLTPLAALAYLANDPERLRQVAGEAAASEPHAVNAAFVWRLLATAGFRAPYNPLPTVLAALLQLGGGMRYLPAGTTPEPGDVAVYSEAGQVTRFALVAKAPGPGQSRFKAAVEAGTELRDCGEVAYWLRPYCAPCEAAKGRRAPASGVR